LGGKKGRNKTTNKNHIEITFRDRGGQAEEERIVGQGGRTKMGEDVPNGGKSLPRGELNPKWVEKQKKKKKTHS